MQEKLENSLENLESLKQTITLDFQNLREIVNGMSKSILAFSQAKIDISFCFLFLPCLTDNPVIRTLVKWFAYLVNEPSLGLFYIQMHFRESLMITVENKKSVLKTTKKVENTKIAIAGTLRELDEISDLNTRWASSMSSLLDQL